MLKSEMDQPGGFIDKIEDFLKQFKNNQSSVIENFINNTNSLSNSSSGSSDDKESKNILGNVILIFGYGILFLISLFGNSIVMYVILKNRRMYTVTNFFIANMAISDLFLTVFNVPFNIARNLMHEWPFGNLLCHLVNFSLMVSVYVSTFTLTSIALDRQRVLLYPLRPRMGKFMGLVVLAAIWLIAICFSLPYGIYTKVTEVSFITERVLRCRSDFPEPSETFEKCITIVTIFLQYIIPLFVIAITYGRIVRKLWNRTHLGAVTHTQQMSQTRAKKKSIKLLITVVVVFALCWMPLNLYHILTDFHPDTTVFRYDSTTFFIFHWIAISSTCYNPFVYCWLNEAFKEEVKSCFGCCKRHRKVHPGTDVDGILMRSDVFSRKRNRTISSVARSSTTCSSIRLHVNIGNRQFDSCITAPEECLLITKNFIVTEETQFTAIPNDEHNGVLTDTELHS